MNQPAAELDEEEQNVDRLRRWHRELRSRDVFDSVDLATIAAKIDACSAELERFTGLVYVERRDQIGDRWPRIRCRWEGEVAEFAGATDQPSSPVTGCSRGGRVHRTTARG